MKGTLEKIVNEVKEVGRKSLNFVKDNAKILALGTALAFGGIFVEDACGGELWVYNKSNKVTYKHVNLKHIEGATENYDNGSDNIYLNSPNKLQIYSKNLNCLPTTDKVSIDARGINSTTTYNLELASNGGFGTADNYFRFEVYDNNNFEWKNFFLGGANDSNNIVADIKYVIANGSIYPDGIPYGDYQLPDVIGNPVRVYDKRKAIPKNHADHNRDGKVDFLDYSIQARNHGRTGIVKGSDVNDLGAYADMQDSYDVNGVMTSYGDGVVDFNDLGEFVGEWCWDANDANSW